MIQCSVLEYETRVHFVRGLKFQSLRFEIFRLIPSIGLVRCTVYGVANLPMTSRAKIRKFNQPQ